MSRYTVNELPADASAKLAEAADIIEQGWCRHYLTYGSRCCAVGALRKVTKNSPETGLIIGFLQTELLGSSSPNTGTMATDLIDFNDNQAKNRHDVSALFRIASDLLA